MSLFDDAIDHSLEMPELSVAFLKKHNYGVRNVFDGFNLDDFEYFDKTICNGKNNGYRLYSAYYQQKVKEFLLYSIEELYDKVTDLPVSERIIEFIGFEFYIYVLDSDAYMIFGRRDNLAKLTDYQYSDEYARKRILEGYEPLRKYYKWAYDTYQNL